VQPEYADGNLPDVACRAILRRDADGRIRLETRFAGLMVRVNHAHHKITCPML
jgi:hypothetical protein